MLFSKCGCEFEMGSWLYSECDHGRFWALSDKDRLIQIDYPVYIKNDYKLVGKLRGLRGKAYIAALNTISRSTVGTDLCKSLQYIHHKKGKVRIVDIGALSLAFDLSLKATMDILEMHKAMPFGMYEKFFKMARLENGKKLLVRDVLDKARKEECSLVYRHTQMVMNSQEL